MKGQVVAVISNSFEFELRVDLEPVPETYMLEPGHHLTVVVTSDNLGLQSDFNAGAILRFGVTDAGQHYVAIWPDNYDLALIKDGVDVFEP